jgi:protein-S-isoprenylcysteine O-methyltransferase Ste14
MPLREELQDQGNWLFKRRSHLPLLLLIFVLLAAPSYYTLSDNPTVNLLWEIFCLLVSVVGLGVRILTIGFTPEGTSGRTTRGQEASQVNSRGIYSIVRHPLYLGNFIIWFGISLFFHLWWLSLLVVAIFWIYYERIMFAEEAYLREKFGERYTEWASRTPAILPRFKNWKSPNMSFSLKTVLKREYSGFWAIIVTFTLFAHLKPFVIQGKPALDTFWMILFLIGLVIYLTLRTLKRKTRVLDVKGR